MDPERNLKDISAIAIFGHGFTQPFHRKSLLKRFLTQQNTRRMFQMLFIFRRFWGQFVPCHLEHRSLAIHHHANEYDPDLKRVLEDQR